MQNATTDRKSTNKWLVKGKLKSETEALVVAMQDGVIKTKSYRNRILKESVDPICRLCGVGNETVGHILSSCPNSLFQLISERHDEVVEMLARAVRGKLGVRFKSKDHVKGAVYHKGGTRVVVDRPIVTDSEVAHTTHRLDIVVFQRNKVTLIEVAVAWDHTVTVREREKHIKYQDLAPDITGQYDAIKPVYVCTVMIGALGALGTVCRMSHNLTHTKLLKPEDFWRLAGSLQRAVLIKAVRIVKRHLASKEDLT